MPQAGGQFGASSIVAEFQGFVTTLGLLVTRAAQNCSVVTLPGTGQYQLELNNVVPDDANFMLQIHQFIYVAGESSYPVQVAFPPVGGESTGLANGFNYIQFGFYTPGGAATYPCAYGLFNIVVLNCNDGLVGLTNPATGLPFRTPGNP